MSSPLNGFIVLAAVAALAGAAVPPRGVPRPADHETTAVSSVAGSPAPDCLRSLQSMVDGTPTAGILQLPGCTFRGSATVDRPMSIVGSRDTEITGLDVWSVWSASNGAWVSAQAASTVRGGGECRSTAGECHTRVEVFIDRTPLSLSTANVPEVGSFSVRPDGRIAIGADPAGHVVEVTARARWLDVQAADVSIAHVSFFAAANDPQAEDAALRVTSADRFSLSGSTLVAAHGALLGIVGGSGISISGNRLSDAGQEGLALTRARDVRVSGNDISGNNTAGFDPEWEAGAGKATRVHSVQFTDNTVADNRGPGLWCDIACSDVEFSGNRVSGNERSGILYEISNAGRIDGNVLWSNGWGKTAWGWGAAILISTSATTSVSRNVVAWNADGITVVRQDRPDAPAEAGRSIVVTENTVISASDPSRPYLLAWLDDDGRTLFASSSGNRGAGNRFWAPEGEARFAWSGDVDTVDEFSRLAGGQGSVSLDVAARNAALAEVAISMSPTLHPPGIPDWASSGGRILSLLPTIGTIIAVVLAAGIAFLGVRWSRHSVRKS
jgi:parallel beta-helix repeat protein